MGFNRAALYTAGKMPQPSRVGDGLVGNVLPANVTATATLTVAQVSGGLVSHGVTLGAAATYTLPTAAALLAAWPDMDIGDAFTFVVTNAQAAAFLVIVAVGAGITAVGANNSLSVVAQSSRAFTLVKTSSTTMDLY